ncbi:hypothetical protein [Segatella maculosa]|nr:hypothetical protein [Segatella maculosa]
MAKWLGLQGDAQPCPPKTYPDPPKGRETDLVGMADVIQRLLSP